MELIQNKNLMNRIEIIQLIESGAKPYFQINEAVDFFVVNVKTLKAKAIENSLFEHPSKFKKTKNKRPMLKAKDTLKVMQELGYPKAQKTKKAPAATGA